MFHVLIYCDPFERERTLIRRSKNYNKVCRKLLYTIRTASHFFVPMALPLVPVIDLMINAFEDCIKALDESLKEYDSGKIQSDEVLVQASVKFSLYSTTNFTTAVVWEFIVKQFTRNLNYFADTVDMIVNECSIN
jgi:hypothetical protein